MLRISNLRCAGLIAHIVLIGAALLGGSALTFVFAQQQGVTPFGLAQAERTKAFANLPNWSGLWNPVGGLIFDPSTADPVGNSDAAAGRPRASSLQRRMGGKVSGQMDHTLAGYFTDPITNCLPHGMPRLMGGIPGPLEFVVTPEQTWIIWEWGSQLRRIYTDGRGHLPVEDRLTPGPVTRSDIGRARHAGGRYDRHARRHAL